jgi:threonine/homoserine/homoserine lactone efflux protein
VATTDLVWMLSATGFAVSMSATPGPNNAMLAASGANFGLMRTVPHILGVSVGFPAMFAAVALGIGGVLQAHPAIFDVMHWVGAAYLIWLAWRIALARPADPAARGKNADARQPRARPLRFIEAAAFQWANPKAWLAALSGIATYATHDGRIAPAQVLLLTALFLVTCVPTTALWTGLGAGTARILRNGQRLRIFNFAMAALLLASLVPLLAEQ